MTEIFLIRHGETDWNVEKRLQGHLDIDLNRAGERQAAALASAMQGHELDVVISSDLKRALRTARAVANLHGLEVQLDRGLRERAYGAFEGLSHDQIRDRHPDYFVAWRARDMDARFPGGATEAETLREFSARAVAAVTALATRYRRRRIAMVTHGGVLECIYRAASGIGYASPRDFDIRNASINHLLWDDAKLQIVEWSNVAHLSQNSLDEVDK
jgi:probable phosphoglycerate mutase